MATPAQNRAWRQANPAHVRAYKKAYKEKGGQCRPDPSLTPTERKRAYYLRKGKEYEWKKRYGITRADYDRMLAEQEGRCYLCPAVPGEGRFLAVDHDHATGKVRGLLCSKCNRTMGAFDSIEWLERAAAYLRRHQ